MAIENFRQLADYNRWANLRLYGAALDMPEQQYRRSTGVFFGSLHGTLNHLLLTDRIWLKRLTGSGEHPDRLDAILHDNRQDLLRARIAEDTRLIEVVRGYAEADLANPLRTKPPRASPTASRCRISCCICSIIRPITAARLTAAVPFSPEPNRRRSICWRFSAACRHRFWLRDSRPDARWRGRASFDGSDMIAADHGIDFAHHQFRRGVLHHVADARQHDQFRAGHRRRKRP